MRVSISKFRAEAGLSLVEIIASTAIVLILFSIGSITFKQLIKRSQEAVCRSNLRVLHQAFNGYIQEVGYWPQVPENLPEEPHHYYDWLIGEVSPYGGNRKAWVCPADENNSSSATLSKEFVGSYSASSFKKEPQLPYKWLTQPWLMESADYHLKGALCIFPDGSIHTDREAMVGQ